MTHRLTRGSEPNRAREASQRPRTFEKGHAKVGGRKRGTPNVMIRELKVAVIEAAHRLGSDLRGKDGLVGYLTRLAKTDIKTFVTLLRAVLPLQVNSDAQNSDEPRPLDEVEPLGNLTRQEILEELRNRGYPVNFIKLEYVQQLRKDGFSASDALFWSGLNTKLEFRRIQETGVQE
jgi:hypothetical protein